MANTLEVRKQMHLAGFRNKHWGWSAIYQLPMILEDGEKIERCASGYYDEGYAVILATDRRVLFLDKKPLSFRAEDIHYEMITEVEHYLGPFIARLRVHFTQKSFELKSIHQNSIRDFAIHIDQKANQMRLNMSNVNTWSQMLDPAAANPRPVNESNLPFQEKIY